MKTAVIFADGIKQVVFTPENDNEKLALDLITPSDDIELLLTTGTVYDMDKSIRPFTATINEYKGGYLRMYNDDDSKIFVLRPKNTDIKKNKNG